MSIIDWRPAVSVYVRRRLRKNSRGRPLEAWFVRQGGRKAEADSAARSRRRPLDARFVRQGRRKSEAESAPRPTAPPEAAKGRWMRGLYGRAMGKSKPTASPEAAERPLNARFYTAGPQESRSRKRRPNAPRPHTKT